jgi:hypothetical protein
MQMHDNYQCWLLHLHLANQTYKAASFINNRRKLNCVRFCEDRRLNRLDGCVDALTKSVLTRVAAIGHALDDP